MNIGLLSTTSMTAAERSVGRLMRAPDGHPADPPAPAPEPEPQPTTDDLYDQEYNVSLDDPLESESGEEGDDQNSSEEQGEGSEPSEPEPQGVSEEDDPAELKRRVSELERQLADASRPKEKEEPAPQPEESSASADEAPNPDDYEFGVADDKFIAAVARWNARQEFATLQQQEQNRAELNAIEEGWKGAISKPELIEQYPDFHEKVTQGAAKSEWDCSIPMAVLIKNSPVGPHIAYELANNPAEATRLAKMNPQDLLLEFGRLEGRAESKASPAPRQEEAPAPKRTTAAPKPPSNRSRGAGGQFETAHDALYSKMLKEFN